MHSGVNRFNPFSVLPTANWFSINIYRFNEINIISNYTQRIAHECKTLQYTRHLSGQLLPRCFRIHSGKRMDNVLRCTDKDMTCIVAYACIIHTHCTHHDCSSETKTRMLYIRPANIETIVQQTMCQLPKGFIGVWSHAHTNSTQQHIAHTEIRIKMKM